MTAPDGIEDTWRQLRLHLEWAQGFSLILLFARHPQPVAVLRQRVEDSLRLRTRRLLAIVPRSPEEAALLAETILALPPGPAAGPVWGEVWQHAAEAPWQQARQQLLHRLNERRFLLERDLRRPLVLVLPESERGRVYLDAPDLWVIRSFTAELPSPPPEVPRARSGVEREVTGGEAAGGPMQASEREWARLWEATADRSRLDPRDGFAAFAAANERGDFAAARVVALQTLDLARSQAASVSDAPNSRGLAIALDNVGEIEAELGDLEAARAAYGESLELRRRLHEAFPNHPQFAKDLARAETRWAVLSAR